jgi:hypothetical protein
MEEKHPGTDNPIKIQRDLEGGGIASVITGPSFTFSFTPARRQCGEPEPTLAVSCLGKPGQTIFGIFPPKMMGKTVIYDELNDCIRIAADRQKHSDFAYTDFISISTAKPVF